MLSASTLKYLSKNMFSWDCVLHGHRQIYCLSWARCKFSFRTADIIDRSSMFLPLREHLNGKAMNLTGNRCPWHHASIIRIGWYFDLNGILPPQTSNYNYDIWWRNLPFFFSIVSLAEVPNDNRTGHHSLEIEKSLSRLKRIERVFGEEKNFLS